MKNKGFTLIEMLVVIAVIGILSAAVLASLGPARSRAKDSRIISGLNQVRTIAETLYDGDYAAVTLTQTEIAKIKTDISDNQGDLNIALGLNNLTYAAKSPLVSSGFYCVDSAGNAKSYSTDPNISGGLCP